MNSFNFPEKKEKLPKSKLPKKNKGKAKKKIDTTRL